MSVKKDPSGRRSVHVEVEVPGTPEEVWRAIATGSGISSWFVPTELEEKVGGKITLHFAPGMDSVATITEWAAPHHFAAEGRDWGPDAPPVATEWIVEAKSGGLCVVRVVHSLFSETEDWDDQLEGTETGWPSFFRILKLYMTHFRDRFGKTFVVMAFPAGTDAVAWNRLTDMLGLSACAVGQERKTIAGVPELSGVVEWTGDATRPNSLLLRLDQPAPGLALMNAHTYGAQVFLSVSVYVYGDGAEEAVARLDPVWREWINKHFPAPPAS